MHVSGRALCLYFLRHLLRGLGYYGNPEEACRRSACRALSTAISPKVSVARALASGESASSSCLRSVATLKVCSTSSVSVILPVFNYPFVGIHLDDVLVEQQDIGLLIKPWPIHKKSLLPHL